MPDVDAVPEPVPATPPLSAPIMLPTQVQQPPPKHAEPRPKPAPVTPVRQTQPPKLPPARERAPHPATSAARSQGQSTARSPQRTPGKCWQWIVRGIPSPSHASRGNASAVRPLLREPALGNCLPMAICQWRQALAAVGRGRGLGAGGHVPVLGWVLAAVQGREEAADRAMEQGVAVAAQPAP